MLSRLITSRFAQAGVVVLSVATLYHIVFGHSDAIGLVGLVATLATLPGMTFCRLVLDFQHTGVWFSGSYPIGMLATQFTVNVVVWLALVAVAGVARRFVSKQAA